MIDWFWMLFAVLGLIQMLSGICEWTWWWKLAKGFYLPDLVGWRRTRLIYTLSGFAMLWIGISFFLRSLFSISIIPAFAAGIILVLTSTTVFSKWVLRKSILDAICYDGKGDLKSKVQ